MSLNCIPPFSALSRINSLQLEWIFQLFFVRFSRDAPWLPDLVRASRTLGLHRLASWSGGFFPTIWSMSCDAGKILSSTDLCSLGPHHFPIWVWSFQMPGLAMVYNGSLFEHRSSYQQYTAVQCCVLLHTQAQCGLPSTTFHILVLHWLPISGAVWSPEYDIPYTCTSLIPYIGRREYDIPYTCTSLIPYIGRREYDIP